ncbi:Transmembrane protein [Globisporangium polare]
MAALFPSFFSRTKRKMSGPAVTIALDLDDAVAVTMGGGGGGSSDVMGSGGGKGDECMRTVSGSKLLASSSKADSSSKSSRQKDAVKIKSQNAHGWFCALCRSVDVHEVLGFVVWKVLLVLIVVLAVADWIFFFKFVVEPDEPQRRLKNGTLWGMFTLSLLYFRSGVRAKCGEEIRRLADHLEIFIAVSLAMVFSTNIAFYLHAPSSAPLRDLGFMLIPAQSDDSKWRPLSDVLTAVMPVLGLLQTVFMTRENRCRVIATFFRVAAVAYALRMLTVSLTSLPGPAPHCRPGSERYFPPQNWIDVVTRVGPMYGQFNSCGDLIFSGHMAYTNSALLLYLRTMDRHFARFSKLRWTLGAVFLLTLAALCVSGRKHYTVDVMLGIMVSSLVFFHFEHGWVPLAIQHPHGHSSHLLTLPVTQSKAVKGADGDEDYAFQDSVGISGDYGDSDNGSSTRRLDPWLYHAGGGRQQVTSVDFIC